jgi:hypothetical protein
LEVELSPDARQITEAETEVEPTLQQMLVAYDPKKHGGEVMAWASVGSGGVC